MENQNPNNQNQNNQNINNNNNNQQEINNQNQNADNNHNANNNNNDNVRNQRNNNNNNNNNNNLRNNNNNGHNNNNRNNENMVNRNRNNRVIRNRDAEAERREKGIPYPPIDVKNSINLPMLPYNSKFNPLQNRNEIQNAQYTNYLQYLSNKMYSNSRGFSSYHLGSTIYQGIEICNALLECETDRRLREHLRDVIYNIATKTTIKQENIVVDSARRCVKIINIEDMKDKSQEISYSNMIMPGSPIYNYPCNPIVYKGFDMLYRIKKYGVTSVVKSSNEHYFYESVRGMTEFIHNIRLIQTKSYYVRYTLGENVLRSSYIGGTHFLRSDGSIYDDMRVDKYINGSLTPSQNIVRRRYIHDYIRNNDRNGIDFLRENNTIMCSTDAIYYNPDIYMSDDGLEHAHCFNCFNWDDGGYLIDKVVSYVIETKCYRFDDHKLVELPNMVDDAEIVNEEDMIAFQQGHTYRYKKVTMYVKGNSVPYEHPFPIFNKMIMSINNIKNQEYRTCFPCLFNLIVNIKNNLFYVSMFAYTNRGVNRNHKPIIERVISFDNTEKLDETSISKTLNIVPKKCEIEIQTNETKYEISKNDFIIVNEPKEYFNYITSPITLGDKYAIFPQVKDMILVKSKILKLHENSIVFNKLVNFNDPKYTITEQDVLIEINYKYVNLVLTQLRKCTVTENQINSCISCVLNLSDSEKELDSLSYMNAYTIVTSLLPISTMFNLSIENLVRENNLECERVRQDLEVNLNNKINEQLAEESLNRRKKLITQILDFLKHVKNRPLGVLRRIYKFYHYGDNVDDAIDEMINDGSEVLNTVLLNTDRALQSCNEKGFFNKLKYWFDIFNDNFSDKKIISNYTLSFRDQVKEYFRSLFRPSNILIFCVLQLIFIIFTLCFMKLTLKGIIFQFLLTSICFVLGGEIRQQTITIICDTLKVSFFQIFNLSNVMKYVYKLFVISLVSMIFSGFYTYFILLFTYSNQVFGDLFTTEIYVLFVLFLIIFISVIILVRYRNIASIVFSLVLYMLFYYYVIDILEYFNNQFIKTIFRVFLIFVDFIKADNITKINLIYDSIKIIKRGAIATNIRFELLEMGSCSLNNISEYIRFLRLMKLCLGYKYDEVPYEIQEHYSKRNYNRVKIIQLPKDDKCDNMFKSDEPFLVNHNFMVSGHNILRNKPLKLHRCKRNEFESVYRQIRCGLTYDDNIMDEFIKFAQKEIDSIVENYYKIRDPIDDMMTLEDYFKKLGPKKEEFMAGLADYYEGRKLKFSYRMHNKDDEKLYLNFDDFITKSRNICAQLRMGKMLSGIPCELAMKVLHSYDWCGPGNDMSRRTSKFNRWVLQINNCSAISCDGSSFDSTQHEILIEKIDAYLIQKVMKYHSYLYEIFNKKDLDKYSQQTQYTIFSRKGFKYVIRGTQLSGRMNTCLCNTLRSHLYVSFILYKANINQSKHEVTGDDQIIFMPKSMVDKYILCAYRYVYAREDMNIKHGLGQISKIFNVYDEITGAEYLSMILIMDPLNNKIYMTRKIDRFFQLTPFTFRLRSKNPEKLHKFRIMLGKDIIECIHNTCRGIKIFEKYLLKAIELNIKEVSNFKLHVKDVKRFEKIREKFFIEEKYKGRVDKCYYDQRFNELYHQYLFKEYGITDCDIQEYYDEVDKVTSIDSNIHVSLIDKLYKKVNSCQKFISKEMVIDNNRSYLLGKTTFSSILDWFVRQKI